MKKTYFLKTLFVAACLIAGVNCAWAYEIPSGMEVKEILIGTANAENVDAYTFSEDGASVPGFTNSGSFAITTDLPTDVWNSSSLHMSESVLRLGSRSTHEIDFTNTLSSGQIVFATDFYVGTHQKQIKFIDENDKVVAYFAYPDKSSSNSRVYGQQYLFAGEEYADGATFSSTPKINDTYLGTRNREYQITEFVIDLDNNKITYSGSVMDRRSSSNGTFSDNATITFSDDITIKGVIIDATACGSNTYYAYFDNMKLFSVGAAAGSHNYAIKAVAGGSAIKTFVGGTITEGETYSVYVPKAILSNSKYYILDDADNANLTDYYASYTMGTSGDEVREINYTLNPNVVYYGDWETAYSTTSGNYGVESEKAALSQGQGRTIKRTDITMNLSFTAPVAGKYQIDIPYLNTNSSNRTHIIYLDGTEESNILETKSVAKNGGYGTYSGEVELTAGSHTIYVKCTYNLTAAMDYLMVTLKKSSKSISSAGYATFCSSYALNFTDTGLTAYIATATADRVSFEEVTSVPANTGVLLKGDANTYEIPVVASSATDVTNNVFVGVTEATEIAAKTGFVLMAPTAETVGFYKNKNAFTVGANTAYIPASVAEGRSFIGFDDETTGISTSLNDKGQMTNDKVVYNLQGQRVQKAKMGLYIQNGKKFVVK